MMLFGWCDIQGTATTPQMKWWHASVAVCSFIERFNRTIGLAVAWFSLFMALTTFVIVVMRYGFNTGSIRLQESVLYMHGMLFMLSGAYCLQQNQHVRIDIFYSDWHERRKTLLDLLGTLFLLMPVAAFTFFIAWEYVASSWLYLEKSREPSGLPFIYLLKTVILIMPAMLFIQAIADAWRHYGFLRGWLRYEKSGTEENVDRKIS